MKTKLNAYHQAKKPDKSTADGIKIEVKGGIQPCPAKTASLNIADTKGYCFSQSNKTKGQNGVAQHAVPGDNYPACNKAHAHAKKEQNPDIGRYAKKIIQKTGEIRAKCTCVVFYFIGRTDRLIKRRVVDIVTPEANPNQQA